MTAEAISFIQTVWPRHTAKFVARRWGRAVRTAKMWLRDGVPEYMLQTILADLDDELQRCETELMMAREALRKARHEASAEGYRGSTGAGLGQSAALVHQAPAGQGSDTAAPLKPLMSGRGE